jgi:hypothetical protein
MSFHDQKQVLQLLAGMVASLNSCIHLLNAGKQDEPDWYDHSSYPHGAKAFRRHIKQGMPAMRCGRGYRCKRSDAEDYWQKLKKKPQLKTEPTVDELLRLSGIIAKGVKR